MKMELTGNINLRIGSWPIVADVKSVNSHSDQGVQITTFPTYLDNGYMLIVEDDHKQISIIVLKHSDIEFAMNMNNSKIIYDSRTQK